MIELPEAVSLSRQLNETIKGKKIARVIAGFSPHKFAWYHGDPKDYHKLLCGKTIGTAIACAGMLEIQAGDALILFDEVGPRFHTRDEKRPKKHQLLIEFEDGTAISATIQLYGGLYCFKEGEFHNPYYEIARARPSPLLDLISLYREVNFC